MLKIVFYAILILFASLAFFPAKGSASNNNSLTTSSDPTVRVVMYTTSTCSYCIKAKAAMKKANIKFEERNITTSKLADQQLDELGFNYVPVIYLDGQLSDINKVLKSVK